MKPYDFTIEEYSKFLDEQVPNRNKLIMFDTTANKRGRKPNQVVESQQTNAVASEAIHKTELPALLPRTEQQVAAEHDDLCDELTDDRPDNLPALYNREGYIDFSPRECLPLKYDVEARLLGHFCTLVIRRLEDCESKVEEWKQIVTDYNNGSLVPELYKLRGERKERSLRSWIDLYIQTERDMYALLHGNKNTTRQRKISEPEGKILLSMLLHPNRITIGSAITMLKAQARMGQYESPSSKPTLRRGVKTGRAITWRSGNRPERVVSSWQSISSRPSIETADCSRSVKSGWLMVILWPSISSIPRPGKRNA